MANSKHKQHKPQPPIKETEDEVAQAQAVQHAAILELFLLRNALESTTGRCRSKSMSMSVYVYVCLCLCLSMSVYVCLCLSMSMSKIDV